MRSLCLLWIVLRVSLLDLLCFLCLDLCHVRENFFRSNWTINLKFQYFNWFRCDGYAGVIGGHWWTSLSIYHLPRGDWNASVSTVLGYHILPNVVLPGLGQRGNSFWQVSNPSATSVWHNSLQFVQIEAIISAVLDEYPRFRPHKTLAAFVSCVLMMLVSTLFITRVSCNGNK